MAPRTERRYRKAGGWADERSADSAFLDAPPPRSPRCTVDAGGQEGTEESNAASQGISILKEIFPDHGKEASSCTAKEPQQLHTMLSSVPSPARAPFGTNTQPSGVPFGPPSHAPMPMVTPVVPPAPPVLPASACRKQWEQQPAMGPLLSEPGFTNYRERLRAGGRGAFQRAIDAGFVPKSMKQDWGALQMSQVQGLSYDGQQMWNGAGQMHSNDYCSMAMAQYSQDYCGVQMQVPPTPGQMMQMPPQHMDSASMQRMAMQQPMLPQMAVQQPMQQMQTMQMPQGDQSPARMLVPQMDMQQMQLPQMSMAQVQTPSASGASTPAEIENVQRECLAMIMPHAIGCDKDLLTSQLQAAAECQCYED